MKVKLKTWKQFVEEFYTEENWSENVCFEININGMYWFINKDMIQYFGTEIEVYPINNHSNYTHKCKTNEWVWHESWFEGNKLKTKFKEIDKKEDVFLKKLKNNRNVSILNSLTFKMEQLINLKRLTGHIQFPCQFNDKGLCNAQEKGTSPGWIERNDDPRCCCIDCRKEYGYLNLILKKDIKYYSDNWDDETGFWRKGKGCILDREKRSVICLTYFCDMKSDLYKSLDALRFTMKSLER